MRKISIVRRSIREDTVKEEGHNGRNCPCRPEWNGKKSPRTVGCPKNGADAIIDDGILIKDGKVVGGTSAKKEKNRIMAVRRAILSFRDMLPTYAARSRSVHHAAS